LNPILLRKKVVPKLSGVSFLLPEPTKTLREERVPLDETEAKVKPLGRVVTFVSGGELWKGVPSTGASVVEKFRT